MKLFWKNGGMFVKDLIPLLPGPRSQFNTVSTQVRMMEKDVSDTTGTGKERKP